jgi:archaemetzincin
MQPRVASEATGKPSRPLAELVPLGAIHDTAADVVAGNLQAILDLPTDVLPPLAIPEDAFMSTRRQYDAARIIAHLSAVRSIGAPICLGLTGSDLGTPILTYVYGESQLGGRVAVVSLYRLTTAGRETTLERLSKLCLHEVGHVLGIGHCWEHSCLMHSIRNIEQVDTLEMAFCESCSYELGRRVAQLKKKKRRV